MPPNKGRSGRGEQLGKPLANLSALIAGLIAHHFAQPGENRHAKHKPCERR